MAPIADMGKSEIVNTWINHEDGERRYRYDPCYRITVIDDYGIEYTHRHAFPYTAEGYDACQALLYKVRDKIAKDGIKALDINFWNDRVIYGSKAYQDEELYIVERERQDAIYD